MINRPWVRILVLGVLVFLLAACTSASEDEETSDVSTTTASESDTTTAEDDGDGEEAGDDESEGNQTGDPAPDSLIVHLSSEIQAPFIPLETGRQGNGQVFSIIYDPLFFMTDENEIASRVLESWEFSDDATTLTLEVAEGRTWNDGTPITAADVVTTLEMYLDSNISVWAGRIGGVLGEDEYIDGSASEISGISAEGSTVEIVLKEPDVAWLANIAAISFDLPLLPDHVFGDMPRDDILANEFWDTHPVSSGPYQFVTYQTDQFVELEANPNWSLGTLGFDSVIMRLSPTDVATTQLETGELHILSPLSPTDAEALADSEGIVVESRTGVAPEGMVFDWPDPQLNDPRIRQAIMHAIDREAICQTVLAGFCSVPLTNVRLIAPEWAIPTEGMIEYDYDPERARELLDEAGWQEGDTLVLFHTPGVEYRDQHVVLIQGYLAEVGIDVEIVNIETGPKVDAGRTAEGREAFSFFIQSGANFTVDPSSPEAYARCDTHRSPTGGANSSWFCNPELDALWDAGRLTADQDERTEIYHDAFRLLNADPPNGWLFVADSIVAYNENIVGVMPHGNPSEQYWNIGDWRWGS